MSSFRLGVDVGGTFTDFALVSEETETITFHKQLTTPKNPSDAVIEGIHHLLAATGIDGAQIRIAIHGTTLITNSLIERKGANVALVATAGMRDVLHTGTENRYDINDRVLKRPPPLVDRRRIIEVDERIGGGGDVRVPLTTESVETLVRQLLDPEIESIAVSLLHAYRYPAHEEALQTAIRAARPQLHVSISSEVAPQIREYPRTVTTVANAYVAPKASSYLADLSERLRVLGYRNQLYLMLSDGGITVAPVAQRVPVRLLESGPAGGAAAAANHASLLDETRVLSFDMGGTTAKICVVEDQRPKRSTEMEVARVHRFKKGSGLPLLVPVVELMEIGAGGGSLARVDAMGLLKVGPDSAGAEPGPACYGKGGEHPTVTDAAVLLGYLNPDHFLGGRMQLNVDAARSAIEGHVASALGVDPISGAEGIFHVATENMADAVRVYLAEFGKDVRDFALMAFGGAGPVHACRIARSLHIKHMIVPLGAGVTSALGFLTAPMAFEFVRTLIVSLKEARLGELDALFSDLLEASREVLRETGVADEAVTHTRWLTMRYVSQTHEIDVEIPGEPLLALGPQGLTTLFENEYRSLYGDVLVGWEVEITGCRLRSEGPHPAALAPHRSVTQGSPQATPSQRDAFFVDHWTPCDVYQRYALRSGDSFRGPAIVEEPDSTTVIDSDARVTVDEMLNLHVWLDY